MAKKCAPKKIVLKYFWGSDNCVMLAMAEFKLFNYVINTGFETAYNCIQRVLRTKR